MDAVARLTPDQLATRLPAFWMHARALRALGRHEEALAALHRGLAIAADTGREPVVLMLTVESVAPLIECGRIVAAVAAAEDGLELAQLGANARTLLWATAVLSAARLAAGDVAAALGAARAAEAIGSAPDVNAGGDPGRCLGLALVAAGNPEAALAPLLAGFGGLELARVLPADRPPAAADLAEAAIAAGELDVAAAALAAGGGATPGAARIGVARSALLLARGDASAAAAAAATAREQAADAPLTAARARLAEGRARAAAGEREAAVAALRDAEAAFARFGAGRDRDAAIRALRALGHRVTRPAREGDGPLTGREHEIAALVAAGRTNREVAEQLVLSPRTVEAHLRSIYGKLGVRSRVELARAIAPG